MALKKGETQRFSMAIIMGENKDDLLLNSETSVRILKQIIDLLNRLQNQLLKQLLKMEKLHLYWDAKSEDSVDPLTAG